VARPAGSEDLGNVLRALRWASSAETVVSLILARALQQVPISVRYVQTHPLTENIALNMLFSSLAVLEEQLQYGWAGDGLSKD
jgi:hypothetical protein